MEKYLGITYLNRLTKKNEKVATIGSNIVV